MSPQAGERIPEPEGFPVSWPDHEMQRLHWNWDQAHHPRPETPLTATFEAPSVSEGASRGFHALQLPINLRIFVVNGYSFEAMELPKDTDAFPPPWWPEVEAEFLRRLPVLTQTWEQEVLPEVQSMNQRLRDFDYTGASLSELLAFIDETRALRVRAWDLHMQVVMPVMGAATRFAELYEQLLGKPENGEPYLMLQGFKNMSTESGKAFWRLSRRALEHPDVGTLIKNTTVAKLPNALQSSADGRAFWDEFQRFLEEFGWRSDAFELADPAWTEDPSIPLATLQDYVGAPDDADPALHEQRAAGERERLVSEAFERLDGHEGKPLFELMLKVSQQYLPIQEDHNFYIDQMNTVLVRLPFLELGRRLAEKGTLVGRDDIFYIKLEELPAAANEPASPDWRSLVAERRAERERWSRVVPPRELGTAMPESLRDNPIAAAFFGKRQEPSKDPMVINGIAASAGTVTAPARVVRTLAEAEKLQPGDVLVCEMTMPAWTPLFATVAAVVADSGGVLSHCAIVAREYGIPCVVGTEIGTQTLRDGQRITVDGAQGLVRIEG